jgi:hypothetical protein
MGPVVRPWYSGPLAYQVTWVAWSEDTLLEVDPPTAVLLSDTSNEAWRYTSKPVEPCVERDCCSAALEPKMSWTALKLRFRLQVAPLR